MEIGIGLPATIPGVSGELVLEWARRADEGPFSSLGIIDRLVYPNFEPLICLAAAAGVTERIRLMTTVLLAPLRNTGILAKQAATLDAISGGRLTLGLGVGGREDDYRAAPEPFHTRGKRFDEQLAAMKRIWSGEAAGDGIGPIGPPPAREGGPELLIGGYAPEALSRVGRWADGFISGGAGPEMAAKLFAVAEESWKAEERPGRPRFVAGVYYALGQGVGDKAASYIKHYYAFMGQMADRIAQSLPLTEEAVEGVISAFEDVGLDELIFWPCVPELDQMDRLADLIE